MAQRASGGPSSTAQGSTVRAAREQTSSVGHHAAQAGGSVAMTAQAEICFAIFANVLELDDRGEPINEKYAERRAATWLYRYRTGELPPGEADLEPWECELY
jgi:hypothetical protein